MTTSARRIGPITFYLAATILGLISAFFIFYTIRLLSVTKLLTAIHTGGQGAYIGAIAFPILATVCGFLAWKSLKEAKRRRQAKN
jgi:F0F1-type ATP synthase membrane subunit b/b'